MQATDKASAPHDVVTTFPVVSTKWVNHPTMQQSLSFIPFPWIDLRAEVTCSGLLTFTQCQARLLLLLLRHKAADSSSDLQRSRTPGQASGQARSQCTQPDLHLQARPHPKPRSLLKPLCPATPRSRIPAPPRPPRRPAAEPLGRPRCPAATVQDGATRPSPAPHSSAPQRPEPLRRQPA